MRWLLTYADMITLLLALFIILFSISTINRVKFQALVHAISGGFDNDWAINQPPNGGTNGVESLNASSKIPAIQRQLEQYVQKNKLQNQVTTRLDHRGLVITLLSDKSYYDSGSAQLRPDTEAVLDKVARFLKNNTYLVRVEGFTISLDGYGAGPDQDLKNPLGVGGVELHPWLISTRTFQRTLFGKDGGTTGVDDDFAARGFQNVGSWILGRNMFGPIRGDWPDTNWKGWWGDNPPYHVAVFVLTHHARLPIEMEGDTTFHFITGWHSRGARPCTRGRCRNGRADRRWAGHNPAVSS